MNHKLQCAGILRLAVLLLVLSSSALAEVQLTETPGTWVLKKGTSNIKTGLASYEACRAEVVSHGTTTLTKYTCNVANVLTVKLLPDPPAIPLPVVPADPIKGPPTLTWVAPAKNIDGTAFTDLAGYEIAYGLSPDALKYGIVLYGSQTSYTFPELAPGTYYFAVRALSKNGRSDLSAAVQKVIQ